LQKDSDETIMKINRQIIIRQSVIKQLALRAETLRIYGYFNPA